MYYALLFLLIILVHARVLLSYKMNSKFVVEEVRFPTPWGQIAAKVWGDKRSITVLTIHGFGENAATFDHLIPLLPQGFYYVCLDLPSHGRSSLFPPGLSLDFFGCLREICRVLLEHLRCSKCILLSHSAGGHFCLFLAALYPEVVMKVVLLDLFPFFLVIKNDDVYNSLKYNLATSFVLDKRNVTKYQFKSDDELYKAFIKKHFTAISVKTAKTLLEREIISDENHKNSVAIISDNRKTLLQFPLMTLDFHLSILNYVTQPVLLIMSSECKELLMKTIPMSRASIKHLKNNLRGLFKIEYVEGNHSVHLEHPERIASFISNFIRSSACLL